MKVLCIQDSPSFGYTKRGIINISEDLRVRCGNLYTVTGEAIGHRGEKKWTLSEKPNYCRYKKEYFSPLSEIEELEEQAELEVVNIKSSVTLKSQLTVGAIIGLYFALQLLRL